MKTRWHLVWGSVSQMVKTAMSNLLSDGKRGRHQKVRAIKNFLIVH